MRGRKMSPERFGRKTDQSDEAGIILVQFALMIVVLVAMAGFGVDVWNWWYSGQKAQRAADAAALAGVSFMPGQLGTAQTAAIATVAANGLTISSSNVQPTSKPNQLKVDVSVTVTNSFTSLLGIRTTTLNRSAVAEYTGRVAMGAPDNTLGNDPDKNDRVDHWISDSGRITTKQGGDRFQSGKRHRRARLQLPGRSQRAGEPGVRPERVHVHRPRQRHDRVQCPEDRHLRSRLHPQRDPGLR